MIEKITQSKAFISEIIEGKTIESVIVLGSGMSGFEENYKHLYQLNYSEIPNFLQPSIDGHSGKLSIVDIEGKITAILSGRAHFYEGYPIQELVIPIRTFITLGAKTLILTNAAGGISDHINLTGDNPLIGKNLEEFGPRFPDMSNVYNSELLTLAEKVAENHFEFKTGVYAWFTGPSYETPAEVNFAKNIGADLVGMSTVPEAIVAKHAGIKTVAFSLVTNLAAGISKNPLDHNEVIEIAEKSKVKLQNFMQEFLSEINISNN